MRKKSFIIPNIKLSAGGGEGTVIGGGTGQSTTDLVNPMGLLQWLNSDYADDLIIDNDINELDYFAWWYFMMTLNPDAFTLDAWKALGNSEDDWYDYIVD